MSRQITSEVAFSSSDIDAAKTALREANMTQPIMVYVNGATYDRLRAEGYDMTGVVETCALDRQRP